MSAAICATAVWGALACIADAQPRRETPAQPGAATTTWRTIDFVDVVDAFGAHSVLEASLENRGAQGMRLGLVARGPTVDPLQAARVRLHLPDGTVVPAAADPLAGVTVGREQTPRRNWTGGAMLPWQANRLDEAWIEVDLGAGGRYWLEVPYGFVRNPATAPPANDSRDRPRLARAMATLADRDHLVPFRDVVYEVGAIQTGWRLTVRVSNPFDAHVELELYRDDGGVGQSAFRWDLHDPRTRADIAMHTGGTLTSRATRARLHEDGLRRSDDFSFNRGPGARRGWGTVRATVGSQSYEVRVPSSLYLYTHGTADPYHARRVVGASQVLGDELF